VIAEVRHLDAELRRGLDDRGPRRHFDFFTVDDAFGHGQT
jgi:hypothetical protein